MRAATLDDLKQLLRSLNEHAAVTIDLDGIPVKTISLDGLLLTKLTLRDKDAADRIVIERALDAIRRQAGSSDDASGD